MKFGSLGVRAALVATALICTLGSAASASAATLSGTVSGQAPGEEAKPLPETLVTVTAAGSEEAAGAATADAKGAYSLEVPDGVFDVRFDPPAGYEPTTVREVEVQGSRTLSVVLTSANLVHLTGTLRNAEGDPVSNAIPGLIAGDKGFYGERTDENGHFEIVALPGTYRLSVGGEEANAPNIPDNWSFEIPSLTLESDRDLGELRLPPTARLTVEVLDAEGAPLPKTTVSIPPLFRQADLGGAFATELMSGGDGNGHLSGRTDGDGRISFLVFGGTVAPWAKPEVVPPLTSGYGRTAFSVPPVEGDTTVVVRFTKAGEEEPEEDMAGPHLKELGIEPSSIDTSTSARDVLVRAHIADDLSGFAEGTLVFTSPSGEQNVESSEFNRWNGTATAGDYEIPVLFPQASEVGEWELTQVRLFDADGNETVLGLEQLEAMEFQHLVHVESPPPPPAVTAVEPSSGAEAGGTEVLIAGSGFAAGAEVFFGSTPALEAVVNSDESITAKSPAGSGSVAVTVKTSAGVSEAGPATMYRYSPPVTLKCNPNPAQQGNKVTFTARVTPLVAGAPAPTGAVVFTEGATTLAVASLTEGKATFSTSNLAVGAHTVTARYAGDAYFGPGNSPPVTEDVVPKKGGGH